MSQPILTLTRVSLDAAQSAAARLVTIEIPEGNTTPAAFAAAVAALPDLSGPEIVLITGRAPIWGYAILCHRAHATPAVAVFDPRLGGYVVVQSHQHGVAVGAILTVSPVTSGADAPEARS